MIVSATGSTGAGDARREGPGQLGTDVVVTREYQDGRLVAEGFPTEEITARLAPGDAIVWVHAPLREAPQVLRRLQQRIGIEEVVIEDVLSRHERPRVDHYGGYTFVNTYTAGFDAASGRLVTTEISAIVTPRLLVTVQAGGHDGWQRLTERWDEQPDVLRRSTGGLLHGLVDLVVDGHFDAVQDLDDEAEAIEDLLFGERAEHELHQRLFLLRKHLVQLRRVVLPMREVVNTLLRRDLPVVPGEVVPYYQDVYDHVLRVTEWTESLRDMVTTLFETSLSLQDHQLNLVIKKLTSWAAIIAVPTAVTGFFGQNVRFPGEAAWSGLVLSVGIITVTAVVLYVMFKRRDWI